MQANNLIRFDAAMVKDSCEPTLFVVDDDLTVRKSLAALAFSMGLRCDAFATAEEFLEVFDPSRRGCIIIDLSLEGIGGLDLQERLASHGNVLPVIVVSGFADIPATVRAMRNGALTLLEKPYRAGELAQTIQSAIELDAARRAAGSQRTDLESRIASLDPREREVMPLIVQGLATKSIARQLGVSRRTVDRIRAMVYKKMGVESVLELVRVAEDARHCVPIAG